MVVLQHLVELVDHLGVEVCAQAARLDGVGGPADEQHARAAAAAVDLGRADAVPRHAGAQVRVARGGEAGGGVEGVECFCYAAVSDVTWKGE